MLNVVILSVIKLSVTYKPFVPSFVILSVPFIIVVPSVIMLSVIFAECHYAKCCYVEFSFQLF
jgi:hypothetical protein